MTSPRDDSVTGLIRDLKGGDPDAAGELWQRHFPRLVELCKKRLAVDLCRSERTIERVRFNSPLRQF